MADVTLSSVVGGGSSGAGYDAVATQMVLGNANLASVDGGWKMADQREVIDRLIANLTQITVAPKTLDTLVADASAVSAIEADPKANALLKASGMYLGKSTAQRAGLDPTTYTDIYELAASSAAMASVAASTSAMQFAASSKLGFDTFLQESVARTEIAGNSTGLTELANAVPTQMATPADRYFAWNSDDILNYFLNNSSLHTELRGIAQSKNIGANGTNWVSLGFDPSKKYLMLQSSASATLTTTYRTLRSGSAIGNSHSTSSYATIPIEGPDLDFYITVGNYGMTFKYLECTP